MMFFCSGVGWEVPGGTSNNNNNNNNISPSGISHVPRITPALLQVPTTFTTGGDHASEGLLKGILIEKR